MPTYYLAPSFCGAIAQLGERYNGIVEVGSSILPGSTNSLFQVSQLRSQANHFSVGRRAMGYTRELVPQKREVFHGRQPRYRKELSEV